MTESKDPKVEVFGTPDRVLGINGQGRIGKLTLWYHVYRKYFSRIVVNVGREVGANLEALAQAMTMANAAASSAATARTSVDVVPDIQTSVESFIDPDCLTPVCEEIGPCPEYPDCPPCDSCSQSPSPLHPSARES